MLCLKKLSSRKELMMKLSTCCAALLLALASPAVLAAPGSCERIQSDISQRIINNGVPESSFTLSIVPNDQVDQPDSQVVGHCANDTHKILYTRTTSGNVSAPAQSTQDGVVNPVFNKCDLLLSRIFASLR